MATITIVTRIKATPNSKLGFSFVELKDGRIMISHITDNSIFGGPGGLKIGQEIISINGEPARGKSVDMIASILSSLPREVTIQAGPGEQSSRLECDIRKATRADANGHVPERVYFDKQQQLRVPTFLKSMGVTHSNKWNRIVKDFTGELLPAIQQWLQLDFTLNQELAVYITKQVHKGNGLEAKHERKVFMMTHQAALLHTNLTMIANNILSKANALLNGPHGVMAELSFTERYLPAYSSKQTEYNKIQLPTGIKFTPIEDDNGGKTPAEAASMEPQVAVGVAMAIDEAEDDDFTPMTAPKGAYDC